MEKYADRLSKAFLERGYKVHFFTETPMKNTGPITYHVAKSSGIFGYQKIRSFDKSCSAFLKNNDFDIVFGLDRNSTQTHIRAGNGVHRAYMDIRQALDSSFKKLTSPINPLNRTILDIEQKSFEHPDLRKIICNSNMVKKQILSYYDVNPDKIEVIHNGVEWSEMEQDFLNWPEKKWKNASDLNLDPHTYHYLFVGNGYERKGLTILLHAMSLIRHLDIHLSVVGKEKKLGRFIRLANSLGLGKKVTFFGEQSSLTPFYQIADSLIIPSLYDPCANVTMEALAMGLFVISSKTNGGHEILTPENGNVIPSMYDLEAIVEGLVNAFNTPKSFLLSKQIRDSVQYLDFSTRLNETINLCL
ncbi:MAG: glycosyltransferase family 4 protein [Simkaniaceae bacterium]|nr:glycosyltransferase family 4 protein [Simkaniaceae bacterium]